MRLVGTALRHYTATMNAADSPKPQNTTSLPDCFHPVIRDWFAAKFGRPTDIQEKAWPLIASGEHVFALAPTGSGKTLTAFLWGLNQLLSGAWPAGTTRLLYISPLKALNNDIRKNLLGPLTELQQAFAAAGIMVPAIRSMVRSGDTPQSERRSMLRHPPEIFICTPESLAIMLTSNSGTHMLGSLAAVILDEIHAVAGSKRGTALMANVERLVGLSGEIQRIALSATVNPVQELARFVAGYTLPGTGSIATLASDPGPDSFVEQLDHSAAPPPSGETTEFKQAAVDRLQGLEAATTPLAALDEYLPRPIRILQSGIRKQIELDIVTPGQPLWEKLTEHLYEQILRHHSTLVFVQSRRMAERLTRFINDRHNNPEPLVYSHHGSLSREIRLEVEERLKTGRLRGIVATGSLELGIDIGDLDLVLQVGVPDAVSSAMQRLGRAGHGVGQLSRGILYPLHEKEELEAAVLRQLIYEGNIEALNIPQAPLDVLAQLLLSVCARGSYKLEQLYNFVRCISPYYRLELRHFRLVLDLLCGNWADTRLRELSPRLFLDPHTGRYSAASGTELLLYMNGGTIPDRGYFALRTSEGSVTLGELDEEFVWERKVGDSFALGGRAWKIESIDHNHVQVAPAANAAGLTPFWKADRRSRDFSLCERIGLQLEAYAEAQQNLADLPELLRRQAKATAVCWPHRHHLVFESCQLHGENEREGKNRQQPSADSKSDGLFQYLLHTLWGQRVNQPLAFAFAAAWQHRYNKIPDVFANNDSIYLSVDQPFDGQGFFALLGDWPLEQLLRDSLEATAFFGSRFRENAGRAILLPRRGFGVRQPFWMTRLRSKRLWEAVKPRPDFPILLETWRSILNDEFDLASLRLLLGEVEAGTIHVSTVETESVSPFGADMVWQQTNRYMYEDDAPENSQGAAYSGDPVADTLQHSELRPLIPAELSTALQARLQGSTDGYEPGSPAEFIQLTRDRIITEPEELEILLLTLNRAAGSETILEQWWPELDQRLCFARSGNRNWLCSIDQGRRLLQAAQTAEALKVPAAASDREPVTFHSVQFGGRTLLPGQEVQLRSGTTAPAVEGIEVLAQWLAFYGPLPLAWLKNHPVLGCLASDNVLEDLQESGRIIVDLLSEGSGAPELCDSENLERLLRLRRNREKYSNNIYTPQDLTWLRARLGGLTASMDVLEAVSLLEGWPAKAEAWEESLLPTRIRDYRQNMLDSTMAEGALCWRATGKHKLSLLFSENSSLLWPEQTKSKPALEQLFPTALIKYDFFDLQTKLQGNSADTANFLWEQSWTGAISTDSFSAVRQGIQNGFRSKEAAIPAAASRGQTVRSRLRHHSFREWQKNRPLQSMWFRWPNVLEAADDELVKLETSRERARLLLDRYGFLCPPLLAKERAIFSWKQLRKTLMLMELSGELVSGLFFPALPGPQYCTRQALNLLQNPWPSPGTNNVYWCCATDPASPVGLYNWTDNPELQKLTRLDSNWLVFDQTRTLLALRRNGRVLDILVDPDDPALPDAFGIFTFLTQRQWQPIHPLRIETINHLTPHRSLFQGALLDFGFRNNKLSLELWRQV